jgi:asparagine synthase (glutamine-hydrolysing)
MCGISGVLELYGGRFSQDALEAMTNTLRHRGPDDAGSLVCGPIALGFRRLSIVDLARGHQPMANEDGTVWIVFNGEIYNHADLRPALERRGHRYRTQSDTETILHLYEEYGVDCVHHLRGMFAFAIWDMCNNRLFCARDRLGIKPFYYTTVGGRFAFASEIKALPELPQFTRRLNKRCLPEFFAFGYLSGDETLFEGVRKLLPGHHLLLDLHSPNKEPQITQYWDIELAAAPRELSESDYVTQFEELFTETVRLHLMSDVPLGVFLSGGLDSSSLAAVMSELRREPIQTFSVGYAEEGFSELRYAREVANHLGAQHHEVILGPAEFFASLPQLIWHEDEPLVWPSSVALYHVSRLAQEKVKVVLSGEGADEIFAGYLKYRATLLNLRVAPIYRKVPKFLRRLVHQALDSSFLSRGLQRKLRHSFLYYSDSFEKIHFDNFYSVFPQDVQASLFSNEVAAELQENDAYTNSMKFFPTNGCAASLLNRLLYLDAKTYLVELLMKQDQMSMAASIESRVPFLDHKVVEFAAQLPDRYKVRGFTGKYLLRRVMAKRLPSAILRRTKKGFPTPIQPWLRGQLFERLSSILTEGRTQERGLIRADYVRQLLKAHEGGLSHATEGCWRLLNFELWNRIFIDGDNRPLSNAIDRWEDAYVRSTIPAAA